LGIDIHIVRLIVRKFNKVAGDDLHRPDETNFAVDLAKAIHRNYPLITQVGQLDSSYPTFIELMTLLGATWNAEWSVIDRLVRKGLQLHVQAPSTKIPKYPASDYASNKGRERDRSQSDLEAQQQSKKSKGAPSTTDRRCVVCGRKADKHENGVCPYTAHPDRGSMEQPYLSTNRAKVAREEFGYNVLPESWHCETGIALKPEQIRPGGQTKVANLARLTPVAKEQARAKRDRSDAATSVNSGNSGKAKWVTIAQPERSALKGAARSAGGPSYNPYKPAASQSKTR
jgi:hypothetical protein